MGNGNNLDIKWNIVISFIVGALFIGSTIWFLSKMEDVTPELFFALRLVLALGAGLISAAILGNIKIEFTGEGKDNGLRLFMETTKLTIQAGGPIAITVLVWIYSPEVLHAAESTLVY